MPRRYTLTRFTRVFSVQPHTELTTFDRAARLGSPSGGAGTALAVTERALIRPLRGHLPQRGRLLCLTNALKAAIMNRLTGCGEAWYRAWFGSKRPRVRIPTLRPKKTVSQTVVLRYFFFIYGCFLNFYAIFDFGYFSEKSKKVNKKVNNGRFFLQKIDFKRHRKTAQRITGRLSRKEIL